MNISDMDDIAIKVNNVTKRFKIYKNPISDPIKEILFFWKRQNYYKNSVVVNNVCLEIKRKEVVGIIGANGAGKTTLLKMIAGLLPIDSGEIIIQGKITALLALGVGVHPEFTGRENIFYSGMLLGMSKEEILSKIDSIIEFSELKEYINYPFRTYSSGMKARLLFSTSVSIDPDILIVDEALATGDAAFVYKSSERIREICKSGATVIFVSHSLEQIERLCTRCLVMHKGNLIFDGDTQQALVSYTNHIYKEKSYGIKNLNQFDKINQFRGTGEIQVEDSYFVMNSQRVDTLIIGNCYELHICIKALTELPEVMVCIEMISDKSPVPYCYIPSLENFVLDRSKNNFKVNPGKSTIVFSLSNLMLGSGSYKYGIEIYSASVNYFFSYETSYCAYNKLWNFQVVYSDPKIFNRSTLTEIPIDSIKILTNKS
jgi:ABC-type polysaccharide/polyol phosphate transport system ATPase subunit